METELIGAMAQQRGDTAATEAAQERVIELVKKGSTVPVTPAGSNTPENLKISMGQIMTSRLLEAKRSAVSTLVPALVSSAADVEAAASNRAAAVAAGYGMTLQRLDVLVDSSNFQRGGS